MQYQYIHHIAGRLRLKFSQLKNRPDLAHATEIAIRKLYGVISAETNVITGSLLIRYDTQDTDCSTLLAALDRTFKQFDLSSAQKTPAIVHVQSNSNIPAPPRIPSTHTETMLNMLIEKCIERSVVVVLGALL